MVKNKEIDQYTFTAKVTNKTKDVIKTQQVDIVLKDKEGNELITLLGYIGQEGLAPNETKVISASTSGSIPLDKAVSKEIKAHPTK